MGGLVSAMQWFALLAKLALPLSRWYGNFYIVVLAILLWYKTHVFTYTIDAVAEEAVVLFFFAVLLHSRLALLGRGYGTKRASILMLVTWLGPVVAFIYGFHLSYQVYVLQLDVILASVGLGSLMLEAVLIAVLGLVLADNLAERLVLLLGSGATVAAGVVLGLLHLSLESSTAFPDQDQPTTVSMR
ncbi:unnamed protein product [Cladocopium goreaui]|uniref:Uncharacterized protein n=1 Tax=Cladocopium goreaui TaxID=2562237 RepID=A0A9P1DBW8_9DINO|nr:unnamed protein product [Cladocopium goreaui]